MSDVQSLHEYKARCVGNGKLSVPVSGDQREGSLLVRFGHADESILSGAANLGQKPICRVPTDAVEYQRVGFSANEVGNDKASPRTRKIPSNRHGSSVSALSAVSDSIEGR